jgi:hypothetical protein
MSERFRNCHAATASVVGRLEGAEPIKALPFNDMKFKGRYALLGTVGCVMRRLRQVAIPLSYLLVGAREMSVTCPSQFNPTWIA